jgi:hypothetical protein
MRGAGYCLEAVDGHGHTVDESLLLEAAKVERVVQVEDLECVRPVLAVDEVRDPQLGGLQALMLTPDSRMSGANPMLAKIISSINAGIIDNLEEGEVESSTPVEFVEEVTV